MKSSDAYADLLRLGRPVVETGEAAARLGLTVAAASHQLRRLQSSGLVRRLRRGLWSLATDVDPFVLPPYLTAPLPAYVSLWSALAVHGMIEQIPRRVYVASLARSQRISTTVGDYSIHHLAPELFGGYVHVDKGVDVATPEKALFDTIYLLSPGGGEIRLPELELPARFEERRLREWTDLIESGRLRTLVARGLDRAMTKAARASEAATALSASDDQRPSPSTTRTPPVRARRGAGGTSRSS
jgi:predicted transcriptional regulator of viral defense system